jgi:tRNA threonylcarbamoyladenosine biosynthesis protein TsaB
MVEVERAAEAAGGWDAIERIAVGVGPGSFTGLRVGVSTARALGLSLGILHVGVSTLDALGRGIGENAGGSHRLAVLDARRGEVFASLYSPDGEQLWGPLVISPQDLAEGIAARPGPCLGAGPGAVRFRQELANRGVEVPDDADPVHHVAARHICALAVTGGGVGDAGPTVPIYLRPPDAERWRERDTLQKAE